MDDLKQEVRDFWNEASCGERLLLDASDRSGYQAQLSKRYSLEPFIEDFARFDASRDLDVLEIGVGLGADHQRFAQAGARLTGIDLTDRAVEHTGRRFELFGLKSDLRVADAESLPFADASFDWVYSWGVLHHSPDTAHAIDEVWRVLRPGGVARIMIYHKHSLVGYMLWLRYALLAGKPWRNLGDIYANPSRKSGHEGLHHGGSARAFPAICRGQDIDGIDPRRSAGIRCRAASSRLVIVAGKAHLATPPIALGAAGAWLVHADRGGEVKGIDFVAGVPKISSIFLAFNLWNP